MKIFIDSNLLIYLNCMVSEEVRTIYENFYLDLLSNYKAYTDLLVLDEVIFISREKFKIPYDDSIAFLDSIVLPYVKILSVGEEEHSRMKTLISKYNLKPSDAIHIAIMEVNNISKIASEDHEFDKIDGIKRIWIK